MQKFLDLKGPCGYLELSQAIIEAIECGRLSHNSPLPPSRVLAELLGVSRDTILNCYSHLKSLGWTEIHGTAGTYVAAHNPARTTITAPAVVDKARLSQYGVGLLADHSHFTGASSNTTPTGAVPREFLPLRRWRANLQASFESTLSKQVVYEEAVLGSPELRSAAAAYFNRSNGIPCSQEEIVIFNISFSSMAAISRLFLEPGDVIAVEDPGYGGIRDVAALQSLQVLTVPLDGQGISLEALQQSAKPVRLLYVTPNHQEPTGMTMSLERRKQLLAWAQKNGALIIEDDYDGFFHYGARMPPSLKSMDTQENVVHLASFWQVLYPLTTLSIAIIPRSFMEVIRLAQSRTASLTDRTAQLTLAEMLNDGYLQKHCRKLERQLAERRRALIYELKRNFAHRVNFSAQTGGLTLMARFAGHSDEALLNAAKYAGVPMASTERFYVNAKRQSGEFHIHFAELDEGSVSKVVQRFTAQLT